MHIQLPYLHRILRGLLEVLPVRIFRKDLLDSHALGFGAGVEIGVGVGLYCKIIDKIYISMIAYLSNRCVLWTWSCTAKVSSL